MISFKKDFIREPQNHLGFFFFLWCIATIPDFNYCSWHSRAYGNITDKIDIKWHSKLSSLSDQLQHLCLDTDIWGFHSPVQATFSLPGQNCPKTEKRLHSSWKKIKKKLFFQLSNLSSKLLCAATFSTVYSSKSYSKNEKCGSSYTRVHICAHTNTGRAVWLEEVVYLALARSHEGTMARLKMIGHVVC